MTQSHPLPVEPLTYEHLAADAFEQRTLRLFRLVGLLVGFSRMLTGCYQAWLYGLTPFDTPLARANMSWGAWEMGVAGSIQLMVFGALLLWAAAWMRAGTAWARKLMWMNEIAFAASACLIVLMRLGFQMVGAGSILNSQSGPFAVANILSFLVSLGQTLAFSLLVIFVLRSRHKPTDLGA